MPAARTPSGPSPRPRPTPTTTDELAVRAPERYLRALLDLDADASISRFRAEYELAMSRATRCGDHLRAVELSRAFDRLPLLTRERLYPTTRPSSGGSPPPRGPGRTAVAGAPRRPGRPASRGRIWKRVLLYGVVAPLAVAAGTAVGVYAQRHGWTHRPAGPSLVPAPVAATPSRPAGGPRLVVPATAPTGRSGLVAVLCQPGPGQAGYVVTVPRGAGIACTNGATPRVTG